MNIIDLTKNADSFKKIRSVETILLSGDPKKTANLLLSICIPTYKRVDLLKEAIDSALNQVDPGVPYNVIVLDNEDDFSETETSKLIGKYRDERLLYYKNRMNIGMFGNMNRCFEITDAPWVALLHDDDLLRNTYIRTTGKVLGKFGSRIDCLTIAHDDLNHPFTESSRRKPNRFKKRIMKLRDDYFPISRYPLFLNYFFHANVYGPPTCGMLFDRKVVIKSGGFDGDLYPSADWFYLIFLNKYFRVYHLRKNCGIYRWAANESLKKETLTLFYHQEILLIRTFKQAYGFVKIIDCFLHKAICNRIYQKYKKMNLGIEMKNYNSSSTRMSLVLLNSCNYLLSKIWL